jgi:phage regulator Rha-like protein
MTRDGFTLLVMGFTGKKAMEFKERYIEAFNNMEMELKKRAPATINWEDPQQIAGLLVQAIQVTQDQRAKIEEQKTELEGQHVLIEEMKPDVEAFKRLADSEGLYTVRAAATALQTNQKKLFGIISDLR